ncbi:pyridoxamine 5'-phosphate oxidase family protein [Kitasatospora kifunensis]|uniref:Nitroimidazol reductase NimA-like FMN-containing flavoprotein (Pyridoxamine 5'-phosphate oxidase superfamily) n=1 Tax=Kitasatospora kifunensis TaxID=58351 RepID=A0A7W7R7F5_KITKI|nr:pyridoxamine 5'-phosphate oxidase family protein [Kitasatospora kifunensis]MBB4926690.1 nitroimidazol reductase NimA-like FMN-containing flavoprotein (pyridoxamine 5'-phosphate oxidase superfamily) [Kitasatospora kifunensis]
MDRVDRIEELGEAECLRLLSTVPIGRVVYTEHALLRVLPVTFELGANRCLVLALLPDSHLARALDGTVAAFQAEQLDEARRTGWSVVVHGQAEVVRDPARHTALLRSGPRPWVTELEPMFVTLTAELVTGRRLLPDDRPRLPEDARDGNASYAHCAQHPGVT